MIELLSPAGDYLSLVAAVQNGADAVYFGGSGFNARMNAKNFSDDELLQAIDYCHLHSVKAFITLNTLIGDNEIAAALSYANFLYESGADAVIVQDIGLATLIAKHIPKLEIHASTQMGISTYDGVVQCEKIGFSRVVLSRELSLTDISDIHSRTSMPLETFVHGAMCMSFSGGCLFSSMVGARSGNRGTCAQPCRKQCSVIGAPNGSDYNLSLADLCMLEHVDKMQDAGIMSLKIEGRMKKPEYIAAVTKAYRHAIDGDCDFAAERKTLFSVFNRGEFTTGYYFGDNQKTNRIAKAAPSDALTAQLRSSFSADTHTSPVTMSLYMHAGEAAALTMRNAALSVTVTGDICESARTAPDLSRYEIQLAKLGQTPFHAERIDIDCDNAYAPVSALNDLRRRAVAELSEAICSSYHAKNTLDFCDIPREITHSNTRHDNMAVSAHVMSVSQAHAAYDCGACEIVLEYGMFSEADIISLQEIRTNGTRLICSLPVALFSDMYNTALRIVTQKYFDGVEINNLGQLTFCNEFEYVTCGAYINVMNSYSFSYLLSCGAKRITLSLELKLGAVRDLMARVPCSAVTLYGYGRVILMHLLHCPVREHIGCARCGGQFNTLTDNGGREFLLAPMKVPPCMVRLLNCFPLDVISVISEQKLLPEAITLSFSDENADIIANRIGACKNASAPLPNTTRGYFRK